MSAICGFIGERARNGAAEREVAAMLAALRARGPDGSATRLDPAAGAALGFAFLRTSDAEKSPAVALSEDGMLAMACDGHVFNDAALRPWLQARGHTVSGTHSCELLLHLYEEEGAAGWQRADGQFALAIWDGRRRRLVLGRDFLGVRPLYYSSAATGVAFASDVRGLLALPRVPRALDEAAVSQFLTFTSVPGERTLFKDIRKLAPGTAVICSAEGEIARERYWDLLANAIPESDDERFYVERVRALHEESVARRVVGGPMASLLSGGNDSSANASLLARRGVRPLHTFTVGLAGLEGQDRYNDLDYARRVARCLGTEHHEALMTTEEFLRMIPATIDAMDDLVSEPSSVFLLHALRMAKSAGLRVVVTGEANDELCCGHGGMIHVRDGYYRRWLPYMRRPGWLRRALAMAAPVVSPKRTDILRRAAASEEYFWSYETAWMDNDKPAILSRDAAAGADAAASIVRSCRQRFDQSPHGSRDYLAYIVFSMMQDFYFTNLMLGKLDLLASRLGLEPRCPYTAPEYARFVFNVPARFKATNGVVKAFFKKAIDGLLPDEIIYRPKQGFRTPVVELFQGVLGDWAEPVLFETGLTRLGLIKRDHLEDLLRRHRRGDRDFANRLWTATVLNLWYDRWIAGTPSA